MIAPQSTNQTGAFAPSPTQHEVEEDGDEDEFYDGESGEDDDDGSQDETVPQKVNRLFSQARKNVPRKVVFFVVNDRTKATMNKIIKVCPPGIHGVHRRTRRRERFTFPWVPAQDHLPQAQVQPLRDRGKKGLAHHHKPHREDVGGVAANVQVRWRR